MNVDERAKAIVVQLETLRDGERFAPSLQVLTRADCITAADPLIAAQGCLHPAVSRELQKRIDLIDDWLAEQCR